MSTDMMSITHERDRSRKKFLYRSTVKDDSYHVGTKNSKGRTVSGGEDD